MTLSFKAISDSKIKTIEELFKNGQTVRAKIELFNIANSYVPTHYNKQKVRKLLKLSRGTDFIQLIDMTKLQKAQDKIEKNFNGLLNDKQFYQSAVEELKNDEFILSMKELLHTNTELFKEKMNDFLLTISRSRSKEKIEFYAKRLVVLMNSGSNYTFEDFLVEEVLSNKNNRKKVRKFFTNLKKTL